LITLTIGRDTDENYIYDNKFEFNDIPWFPIEYVYGRVVTNDAEAHAISHHFYQYLMTLKNDDEFSNLDKFCLQISGIRLHNVNYEAPSWIHAGCSLRPIIMHATCTYDPSGLIENPECFTVRVLS